MLDKRYRIYHQVGYTEKNEYQTDDVSPVLMNPTQNSKIKNDELQVLMNAFGFTKEQLEQNRRGDVPLSQAGAIISVEPVM